MTRRIQASRLQLTVALGLMWPLVAVAAGPATPPAKAGWPQYLSKRIVAVETALAAPDADLAAVHADAQSLLDLVVLYGPDDRNESLRQAAFCMRLVDHLSVVPTERRAGLLAFLKSKPTFRTALLSLIRPADLQAGTYDIVDQLRQKRADQVEPFAYLAAAVCAVHHKPFERRVNENTAKAIDPIDIFDFYVKNEKKMYFGMKNVPAELLVWVVDVTGSIDELNWALAKYAHDDEIGKHFFDIKYDYTHFHTGAPKALTQRGFTLQNIMDCGGVCADQAYFAMEIGKAIGVPTAYASGASSNGSHAWVGFLQSNGRRGWWNFSSGRYDAYKGVKGRVMDPQTRQGISDSDVSLLAEIIDTKPLDRQTAVALVDAANRLLELEKNGTLPTIPDGAPDGLRKTPRPANYTAALAVIDSALKQYDGYAPAWFAIRDLATADRLSKVERRRWAERVIELGSIRYPDFTLNVVGPMIASVDDVKEQDQLWKNAFTIFQKRFDLAADIRMQQGAMWEAAKQPAKARECYQDVINRYANAGPFIRDALLAMERLIDESGKSGDVLKLYEVTWQHITPPKERNRNFAQSNWYQVGMRYVQKLTEAGDAAKARTVEDQIKEAAAPAAKG